MVIGQLVLALVGLAFVLNVGGSADRLAGAVRPLPAWMTWPWTTSAEYYRIIGAVVVVMSAFLLAAGLQR